MFRKICKFLSLISGMKDDQVLGVSIRCANFYVNKLQ